MWFVSVNLISSVVHTLIAALFYIFYRRYLGFTYIWLVRLMVYGLLVGAIVRTSCVVCGMYSGAVELSIVGSELTLITVAIGMLHHLLAMPSVLGAQPSDSNSFQDALFISTIMNGMPIAFAIKSVNDRKYIYANNKFKDAWGVDPTGKTDFELLSYNIARLIQNDDDMLLAMSSHGHTLEFFTPAGNVLYITKFIVYDCNQSPLYIGVAGSDVLDERSDVIKNMDRQIQELQEKLYRTCDRETAASMCRATSAINNLRQLTNAPKTA